MIFFFLVRRVAETYQFVDDQVTFADVLDIVGVAVSLYLVLCVLGGA